MKKLKFLFAIHNHQPLGNFPHVLEMAYQQAYWPFLKTVNKFPYFKFALHFSGFLWEFICQKHKEALELIKEMVNRRQVELLGGAFYEPILTQIPEKDRQAQVTLMTRFLEETFGITPTGLWLAERVWEPHLASFLNRAGFRYTLLDEEHFHYARVENIYGYYATEDEGLIFNIFPIDKTLRYYIPFKSYDQIKAYFQKIQDSGNDTAIIGDDGEKFGLWPGTFDWVYNRGWLKGFLDFIAENQLEMMTFSEYLDQGQPLGRVYLPPASYEEMMEWVLPPAEQKEFLELKSSLKPEDKKFLRGGQFREFSLKYPESHHLRCRQLQVSTEVRNCQDREAELELYRAQCNDAYWHGVFGGLYLPHLRRAVYQKLISAELRIPFVSGWEKYDFDLDGQDEWILRTPAFFAWAKPDIGGAITEIDYRSEGTNLTDVLTRRQEFYHLYTTSHTENGQHKSIHELSRNLPPEAQKWLEFDAYRRVSFLERILPAEITKEEYAKIYYSQPGNISSQRFKSFLEEDALVLQTEDLAKINLNNDNSYPLQIKKRIKPGKDSLLFAYEIVNLRKEKISLTLTSEWNLGFFEGEYNIKWPRVEFFNGQLFLEAPEAKEIWDFPVKTVSQSEKDYEIITQGISFHFVWRLDLNSGESQIFWLSLNHIKKLSSVS
ncbi:MAG: alpha-amylase/4-alpha-glucanotransferase domain-containing protein [Candidatus Saccharicenans sp.]|nr:MAG: hypothetical protein C0168_07970 [Candidatus Aminicenantes bacterium]HEK85702.1 DUF1926 domain-containing protein [Candidatus Aminicenantes bacterium]